MSGRRRRSNIGRSTVNAKRARLSRVEESSTKREARLSQDRDRHRIQRAREWVNKENSAMNDDPLISYKDYRIVSIFTMSVVCEHCLA